MGPSLIGGAAQWLKPWLWPAIKGVGLAGAGWLVERVARGRQPTLPMTPGPVADPWSRLLAGQVVGVGELGGNW